MAREALKGIPGTHPTLQVGPHHLTWAPQAQNNFPWAHLRNSVMLNDQNKGSHTHFISRDTNRQIMKS